MGRINSLIALLLCVCLTLCCGVESLSTSTTNGSAHAVLIPRTDMSSQSERRTIRPGFSVGLLQIGDTKEGAINKLGYKQPWEFRYSDEPREGSMYTCPEQELNWGDFNAAPQMRRNGIRAFLKAGEVYLIKVESFDYSTPEGITCDSPPDKVRDNYPDVESFVLRDSASRTNGDRDLIYWVDQLRGVAFEFYYVSRKQGRQVGFIYVFNPKATFYPDVCSSGQQHERWAKLEQFALDSTSKR